MYGQFTEELEHLFRDQDGNGIWGTVTQRFSNLPPKVGSSEPQRVDGGCLIMLDDGTVLIIQGKPGSRYFVDQNNRTRVFTCDTWSPE